MKHLRFLSYLQGNPNVDIKLKSTQFLISGTSTLSVGVIIYYNLLLSTNKTANDNFKVDVDVHIAIQELKIS